MRVWETTIMLDILSILSFPCVVLTTLALKVIGELVPDILGGDRATLL